MNRTALLSDPSSWPIVAQADSLPDEIWCGGPQSSLNPAGPQAAEIHHLWWEYFWLSVVVYVVVMFFLVLAIVARHYRPSRGERLTIRPSTFGERLRGWIVGGGVVITTFALFFLLVGDHVAGRNLRSLSTKNAVHIRATGHQWWWEFRYDDPDPSKLMTTANEIHIPVGRPVVFELQSADVIHSFWIPNLHGKRDMIPGETTQIVLQADHPGTYGGQCAEFCGHQHAKMRFTVVAEPEEDFQRWLESQRAPAPDPQTESEKQGQEIFLRRSCVMCHTILGTKAGGMVGPNLTHLASRSRIGAGSLPNTRGHLAAWISDPQTIKPGVRMPPNLIPPDELHPLLDYLESLK